MEKIGRYEVRGEIGHGGMATVYHAYDPSFGREVAIKILPLQMQHNPQFRERFQRESRTIAGLEHPGIVPVYDVGEQDNTPYLVMRYMTGGTLSSRIPAEGMPVAEAGRILSRIAGALDEAHRRGIVHRDLKPGNILFDQYGEGHVSDFGIVKLTEESMVLTGSGVIGTPMYMSPEQASGRDVDGRSDVYSLGVILYEMLTGRLPYEAETPMAIAVKHITEPVPDILVTRPNLPPEVRPVILKALAKEPTHRYQTAGELAADLESVAAGKSSLAEEELGTEYFTVPHTMPLAPVTAPHSAGAPTRAAVTAEAPAPQQAAKTPSMVVPIVGIIALAAVAITLLITRPWVAPPAEVPPTDTANEVVDAATEEPTPTAEPTEEATEEATSEAGPLVLSNQNLDAVEEVEVTVTLGASALLLQAAEEGDTHLFAEFSGDPSVDQPTVSYTDAARTATLRIDQKIPALFILGEDAMGSTVIHLPREVPIALTVQTGLGESIIDLTELNIQSLTLLGPNGVTQVFLPQTSTMDIRIQDTYQNITIDAPEDASGLTIRTIEIVDTYGVIRVNLPESGSMVVHANSPGGEIQLAVPESLEGRLEVDNEFVVVTLQNPRFTEIGTRLWETASYTDAANSVEVRVLSEYGTITILE